MYSEKITYINQTSIKLWNFYENNIIAYFTKRFCSYLSEIGLSCYPFSCPEGFIEVRNPQSTKPNEFIIYGIEDEDYRIRKQIEERFLNYDFNHLLFFDISDKKKEFKVLNQFNELLKIKNESNERLNLSEYNLEFFLNPTFFLILYDSTNESGNFHPPENCSISLPSYSDLNITEQKPFDIQDFYEWLYKNTNRTSRVKKSEINPEYLKFQKDRIKKSPAYEMNITLSKIVRYEYDCSLNNNDKTRLSEILNYFSQSDLKKMGKKLELTKIPMRKNQLIHNLIELSDQIDIRNSIIKICKEFLQIEAQILKSSKKAHKYVAQYEQNLNSKFK